MRCKESYTPTFAKINHKKDILGLEHDRTAITYRRLILLYLNLQSGTLYDCKAPLCALILLHVKSFYLENLVYLVNFRFSREKWFLGEKLAKYAAHWPHVHSCGVFLWREYTPEQFKKSVAGRPFITVQILQTVSEWRCSEGLPGVSTVINVWAVN